MGVKEGTIFYESFGAVTGPELERLQRFLAKPIQRQNRPNPEKNNPFDIPNIPKPNKLVNPFLKPQSFVNRAKPPKK